MELEFFFIIVFINTLCWLNVQTANTEYLKSSIRNYFSDTRHHDPRYNGYKDRARQYIYNEFVKFGLDTEYHTFQDLTVSKTATFVSVIGVLRGEYFGKANDKIIGLGAHYDTVNTTKGVDDNGAGVAAMLEVIRQITDMNKAGVKRSNTMIFASFDLEEYGLSGSKHFVEKWLPQWLTFNYGPNTPTTTHGTIILDTMMEFNTTAQSQTVPTGAEQIFQTQFPEAFNNIKADNFRGDFLNLISRKNSYDSHLAMTFKSLWKNGGMKKYELEHFQLPYNQIESYQFAKYSDFTRSDHYNFWTTGFPAIWLTDSANFRGDMIQCYHNPCDNLDVMLTDENINFLGKTADVITKTMDTLSDPSETKDILYMKSSIRNYFSDTRHHNSDYADYKNKAKNFIYNEFVKFGLSTEYHTFQDLTVSPTATFQTVIGVLKGTRFGTQEDMIVGLGAHYDTVETTKGVDDNGAGVAAMLNVARKITDMNKNGMKRKNTIIFASFDLEEYGYLSGSRHFLEEWMPQWLSKNYGGRVPPESHGVIILDTMMEYNTSAHSQTLPEGAEQIFQATFPEAFTSIAADNFEGDFLNLIYRKNSVDSGLALSFKSAWNGAGRAKFELEQFPLPINNINDLTQSELQIYNHFLRSDHTNFWKNGLPAVWLTDSANFRGDMIKCYHHECDNLDVMLTDENINFLGKTSDAITMTMHKLSEAYESSSDSLQSAGFSAGGIAGIVLGIFLPLIIIGGLVCLYRCQNRNQKPSQPYVKTT